MNNFRKNLKMPRRLFDFECKNSHNTEAFVDVDIKEVQCSECDEIATRIISPTGIYLEPFSGLHPSSYDRWTRVRAEKLAQEKRTNANHGS
jgi:hypothetical protein